MWAKLMTMLDPLRLAFGRLSQREQLLVAGAGGAIALVILLGLGLAVGSAIQRAEHRVKVKADQLRQVMELQGEYKTRQRDQQSRLSTLEQSQVRLVSLVEESAQQSGVNIGQLRPEDGEPNADGIMESRVEMRATGLSADRLQDFLARLERAAGIVIIRRLKIDKPYRRDTVDLELSVSTYKLKKT